MASKSTAIEISVICGLFMLLALWGIIWDISSGLLASGIDGIMLLFVCAMMAGIFFLIAMAELSKSGILPTPAFLRPAPKPAVAAKPAAAAAPAAKAPAAVAPGTSPASAAPKPPSAPGAAPPTAPRPAAPAPATATPAAGKPPASAPAVPPAPTVPPTVPEK